MSDARSNNGKNYRQIQSEIQTKKPGRENYLTEYGKIPPQAIEMEAAVLGAILLDKWSYMQVYELLSADKFYKPEHRECYLAIEQLHNLEKPIDILTLVHCLRERGKLEFCGGPYAISQLTNKVASSANIEYHAQIVAQKHLQRELIAYSGYIQEQAYSDTADVFDLIGEATRELSRINGIIETHKSETFTDHIKNIEADIEYADPKKRQLTGIPTGFFLLDERFGGWQDSDLILIAARPGMGKTAFALQIGTYPVFHHKKRVLMFSKEMSAKQLTARVLAQLSGIPLNRFLRDVASMNKAEWATKKANLPFMYNDNFVIDDRPGLDITEIKNKARRVKLENGLDMVIVDYLQLVKDRAKKGNREQEIGSISQQLKGLAKELDIPVIALSQLSREVEKRGDKRPLLSDLRESGSLEQDADIVIFPYRPEYYGITEDEEGKPMKGIAIFNTAKYRSGEVSDDYLGWESQFVRFRDLETETTYTVEDEYNEGEPF